MAINWNLGDDGVLTIQGEGRMPDYGCGGRALAPWSDEQTRIRHIFIGDGTTEIGMRAFEGCENLQSVDLPETVVRIHARAFYGCKNLTQVRTAEKDTRICHLNSPGLRAWTERRRLEELAKQQAEAADIRAAGKQNSEAEASTIRKISVGPREIRFGLNSFYNVPWAKRVFGDFYIADGTAYACFSGERELTVPEGVHTLGSFVFKDTEAESITLPQSLVTIRAFAFADSKVQSLDIPGKVSKIEDHAFADSKLAYLEFSEQCSCSLREGTFAGSLFSYKKCVGFPELFALKSFQNRTNYGGFRILRVVKRKSAGGKKTVSERTTDPATTGSTKTGIYGVPKIDVARHLMKKMSDGNVIIMIRCEGNRVSRVESFLWDKDEKLINEYLMYPCTECEEKDMYEMMGKDETYTVPGNMEDISIYRDSFTWQEKTDFYDAFPEEDAYLLERQGGLRRQDEGMAEQWFWSADRENFGGPLELEFLKYWNRLHLLHVDTVEECRNRFSGLSFVPI